MPCFKLPFLALCTIAIYSCNPPEYLSEAELSRYVAESDKLSKAIASDEIQIKVSYKPIDLLVSQEIKNKENPTVEEIKTARIKFASHYYFILSLSNSGSEILSASTVGLENFSSLLQTVSFRMAEVVNLTTQNQDTIPVADYIYNRTFGMSNSTDLLFVFDKSKAQGQEWIQLNLDEFGLGIGKQSVRFKVHDLENTPKIYTN